MICLRRRTLFPCHDKKLPLAHKFIETFDDTGNSSILSVIRLSGYYHSATSGVRDKVVEANISHEQNKGLGISMIIGISEKGMLHLLE